MPIESIGSAWQEDRTEPATCLIPCFDGAILSLKWKGAVWDKYVMGAPRPRTPADTMSTHLSALARAGAAVAARAGRVVTYNMVPEAVRDLALLLVGHCAGGGEKPSADLVDEVNRACKGH